jgi:hypothetical protein
MRGKNMLRTLLLLVALLIVIGIALVATGYMRLSQDGNGTVSLTTKDVSVGSTTANVQVPVVTMENRQVSVPAVSMENSQANAQ